MATVHIIGAGVSGLAAAARLAEAHVPVKLYEATAHAGGRARSSTDATLGTIDHGLHLIAGDAAEFRAFLKRIHADDTLTQVNHPLPLPAAPVADYLESLAAILGGRGNAGDGLHADNILRHQWLRKLARLLLHTPMEKLPTRALRGQLWRMLKHGRKGTELWMAKTSLDAMIATPALTYLDYHGASVYFSHALKSVEWKQDTLATLHFARKKIALMPDDVLILATPASFTHALLPQVVVPKETHSAMTIHFAVDHGLKDGVVAPEHDDIDLLRTTAGRISLSIRVADHLWARDAELVTARLWRVLQRMHPSLAAISQPPHSVWREKRAGHTVEARAAAAPTLPPQVLLAGDWLDVSRPASLEQAAATGHRAAEDALQWLGNYPSPQQEILY